MTDINRPLILVDVDGVLNVVDLTSRQRSRLMYHSGWKNRWVQLPSHRHDGYADFRVFVNPAHGRWLRKLACDTGGELAWGTTWEDDANRWVAPLVGLPQLPVAPAPWGRKAPSVFDWTDGRPFVWFDDDEHELELAAQLAADAGQPFLPVLVDYRTGLTEANIGRARKWLAQWKEAAA